MDSRPRLLDLFSGAGGAAKGYQEAGFYVVGVDKEPQPRYAGEEFFQADALEVLEAGGVAHWLIEDFDAIHASPPCQAYASVTSWRGSQSEHPDLIPQTRTMLEATGSPFVIENVPGAPLQEAFVLCGSMFGLPIRRHRYFETNWTAAIPTSSCSHDPSDFAFDHGGKQPESVYRRAMGCEWMSVKESRQAIPPAYTEFIGRQLASCIALHNPEGCDPVGEVN